MSGFIHSIGTVIQLQLNINTMKNILSQSLAKYFLPGGNVSSTSYSFNQGTSASAMLNAQRSAIKLIQHFFSPIKALASKPVFTVTADKVIINVFYFMPNQALNNNTINNLGDVLSKLFGRPVELRLVKLYYPYLNSYILAQYIALNTQKYNFVRIQRMIFGKASIVKDTESANVLISELPAQIVGIKIRVSGRLVTERSKPRQTVQTAQIGSFVKDNKSLVDASSFTSKNKKGAFTIKVWISQRVPSSK
jgi:ribosomal protein S3